MEEELVVEDRYRGKTTVNMQYAVMKPGMSELESELPGQ